MIKKEYIEPSVKAVEIKLTQIICTSETKFDDPQDGGEALSEEFEFEEVVE